MYYSDQPISSIKDDKLGRETFAINLSQAILNLNNTDTFTIGLYGKWGSGKTSLINMVLEELEEKQKEVSEEDKIVVFRFEPWNFTDTNQLIRQFFTQLANKFLNARDQKLIKIGQALEKYSGAIGLASLFPFLGSQIATTGEAIASDLGKKLQKGFNEEDIQKQKNAVVELLKDQTQKILIIIDDIDRLNNEQIRQVFQLIASVAKFPNVIYLVVFDKEIVVKALKNVQEGSGEDFLEKIIQIPIELPDIQNKKVRETLYKYLDENIIQNKSNSFYSEHWKQVFSCCVDPFIMNLRDVNRLCNSVKFKLAGVGEEVDIADMVAISALELALPQIYKWVKNNKSILTGKTSMSNIGKIASQRERYETYTTEFNNLIDSENSSKEFNAETVIKFLSKLFPVFGQEIGKNSERIDLDVLRKNNQIAHPQKFDRYFDLDIDNIKIKNQDVRSVAYSLDSESICRYFRDCYLKGTSEELLDEINALRVMLPENRAKILIKGILGDSLDVKDIDPESFYASGASSHTADILIDLIYIIPKDVRLDFLSDTIREAKTIAFSSLTHVLSFIERAYGRLTPDGNKHDYYKVVSMEELNKLEDIYTTKAKELFQEQNLFDIPGWKKIFLLLESCDFDYIQNYLSDLFKEDINILAFLDNFVSVWFDKAGNTSGYSIENSYQKYISNSQILQAINEIRKSGVFFKMSESIQNKCGVFFINSCEDDKLQDEISQYDVDILLKSWRNEKAL